MSATVTMTPVSVLENAEANLRGVAGVMEGEIASVSKAFAILADNADSVLNLAGSIVSCVESDNITSVLPKVQALGDSARHLVGNRLQATTKILEAVANGVLLLRQLSKLTLGQEAIALETKALSVLTNVEAGRLGAVGAGFQFLARELSDFSRVLTVDTQELATQSDRRRTAIEETSSVLAAELPGLREKLARVEVDLGKDLAMLDSRLSQLSSTPIGFREGVEHTARQIAGVVSAVQAHDITRQQIEHVIEALALMVTRMDGNVDSQSELGKELPSVHAGLTIQIYQLKNIKGTVQSWTSQIKSCVGGILEVSASEVVGIGPLVLEREREVSAHLAHIELLERESQSYGTRIERALQGLTSLMQLVGEHREKSTAVRGRLRLLAFNSIIEATRLGAQAGAILAIAKSIKEISAEWSEITDRSATAVQQIQGLVKQTNEVMEAFSQASNEVLHEAQAQTATALANLRSAAAFAGQQALEMNATTEKMHARSGDAGNIGDRLDDCFIRIDSVVAEIDEARRQLDINFPRLQKQYDLAEIEKLFSASYTTETERQVLQAALYGTLLPAAQQAFAGNSVELF